jgi:monoamine oxidase
MSNQQPASFTKPDVLIVGGGVSGLFAAWRLLKNSQDLSLTVVEKMDHVGGRLETTLVEIEGTDGESYWVHDEEGGMRFIPRNKGMSHLWNLIDEFNLKPVPFVMGDDNNRYYIRGKPFTVGDVKSSNNAIWSSLFNLAPEEKNLGPKQILRKVMDDILSQNGKSKIPDTPAEWIAFRNSCTYQDSTGKPQPINEWGFWSLLHQYGLSEECITFLDHVIGFMGPFHAFINAGEGMQILFDFPAAVSFLTLEDGFQSLPKALAEAIQSMGGEIIVAEKITSLERTDDIYTLKGSKYTYQAEKVILAIPKKPLKDLLKASEILSANTTFTETVSSVKNMELTKVGLYFNERWWHSNKKIKLTNGPNFTDLPLGSVYSFSQYPSDPDKDAGYNGPAALTQYTDYTRGNFWKEMQNIGQMYQTDEFPENPKGTYPASVNLVNEVMKQIKLVLGLEADDSSVPMPVLSTYRVWGQEPFGYGYHQYKMNVNDLEDVYFNIWNPAENVYVCNESWSPEQGWVEGALIMSDFVMILGFGLSPYDNEPNPIIAAKEAAGRSKIKSKS